LEFLKAVDFFLRWATVQKVPRGTKFQTMTTYRPYVPPRSNSYQSPAASQPFTSRRDRPNSAVSSISDVSINEIPPYDPTNHNGSSTGPQRQLSDVSSTDPQSRAYNLNSRDVANKNHVPDGNDSSDDDDSMYADDSHVPPRSREDSLSDVAEAFRNQAFAGQDDSSPTQPRRERHQNDNLFHGGRGGKGGEGRRTPTQASDLRETEILETVSQLRAEVKRLRKELREQCIKQDEVDLKFKGWIDIMFVANRLS